MAAGRAAVANLSYLFGGVPLAALGRSTQPVWQIWKSALSHVSHFGPQEWLLTLIAVVIIGAFCMRGFGSRSNY